MSSKNSPIRLAFFGASGTGKTTLAKIFSHSLGIPLNPVGAREVARAMGFASPYDVDAAGRRAEFQERLFEEKLRWEVEHEEFVTDRTPFDNLTYTWMHQPELVNRGLLDKVGTATERYTHVVYCPLDTFQRLDEDPARVSDRGYHERYDMLISAFVYAECHTYGPNTWFGCRCTQLVEAENASVPADRALHLAERLAGVDVRKFYT